VARSLAVDVDTKLVYYIFRMYTRHSGRIHHTTTDGGPATLRVHLLGPLPILRHFLDKMLFWRIVRNCLPMRRNGLLDHAETLSLLVLNIIMSPAPLYRIAEWAQPYSPAALGISEAQMEAVNDDRVARTLDVLASPPARNLFFRLALHVIKAFEIDTRRIHHDTTSVTFHGQYVTSRSDPRITCGRSKDHRPDLKQLVFGLNISADGAVPVSHQVFSGNRSDNTVHQSNVEELRKLLGRDDFVYVADSKLCTRKNMRQIDAYGGKFVTILPRSRGEAKSFRTQLLDGARPRWRRLLVLSDPPRGAQQPEVYWTTAQGPTHTSEGHRIVWCRSSQKRALDAQIRDTAMAKAEAELHQLGRGLNRGQLRQRSNIVRSAEAILKRHRCRGLLNVDVGFTMTIARKYPRCGRPKKTDPGQEVRHRVYHLGISRNQKALDAEALMDGIFPLVTNLQPRQAAKQDVLLIYKYQPYVEKRHSLLKSELEVAPVYLKKPSRCVGLIHATFLAMILDALIERTIRLAMDQQGITSLPILPEGRHTKTPTTARLLEMFSGISRFQFETGDERVAFPVRLTTLQKDLLRLLDIAPSVYA
jgi:transposase